MRAIVRRLESGPRPGALEPRTGPADRGAWRAWGLSMVVALGACGGPTGRGTTAHEEEAPPPSDDHDVVQPLFEEGAVARFSFAYAEDHDPHEPLEDLPGVELACRAAAVDETPERRAAEWRCEGRPRSPLEAVEDTEAFSMLFVADARGLRFAGGRELSAAEEVLASELDLPYPVAVHEQDLAVEGQEDPDHLTVERSEEGWCTTLVSGGLPSWERRLCFAAGRGLVSYYYSGYPTTERWTRLP